MAKMNLFITILFVCFCNSIVAQSFAEEDSIEKPIVNKQLRFQIGYFQDVNYHPVYTDHDILNGNQSAVEIDINSVAIGASKALHKNVSIEVNCELSSKQVDTKRIYLYQNSTSIVQEMSAQYGYTVQYINIPIGLNYYVGNKFKIGIHNSFAFKFKIADALGYYKVYSDGSGKGNSLPLSNKKDAFNIDYRIGLFVSYQLKQVNIKLMPIYRIDLLNTYKDFNYKHANSYGVGIVVII
jgi:hypothetical protein